MRMRYVGALDQGTTSTRFAIFDEDGRMVDFDQREHMQIYPRAGWVEHDPVEIWRTTKEVIAGAIKKSGISSEQILTLGVTNQRETTVVWNRKTGNHTITRLCGRIPVRTGFAVI